MLTVVAVLLAFVGMVAFYVEHTALDEDGFETISRNLIENDTIRTQVATTAVDKLYENVDVEAAIAERLPPAQQRLAPILAGLSRSGAYRAAEAALERPRVQTVWVEATTAAQRQLVKLLDDKTKFVQTEGGKVVLDLRPIMIELGNQVVVIGKVAERLPESSGRITIIEESQLETAQTMTKILRAVADWMWLVAIAVAALAIWLARGRRRLELRALAIGLRRRRAADACRAPLRRRLSRRPPRQGRLGQARGPGHVEHPHAGPRRPRVGVDRPRRRDAGRSLVRGRDPPRRAGTRRRPADPGEQPHDLRGRRGRPARARAGRADHRPRLAPDAGPDRARRRRHRGRPKHRQAGDTAARLRRPVSARRGRRPPRPDIGPPPAPGMRWIPAGTFAMGSSDFYPEERPVHRVSLDGFWMDETPVTVAQFRRFVRETKYVTLAERPLDGAHYPDADPELLVPGLTRLPQDPGPGRRERPPQLVGVRAGRVLEAARRQGHDDQRPRHASRGPHRVRGRRGLRDLGGQGAPERGGVGARGARRARRGDVRLGRRALPGRQGDGEHVAGRVPLAEPQARRLRGHLAGRQLPGERLRLPRRDRERLGVDVRLVHAPPPDEVESPCCVPRNPRVTSPEASPARRSRVA